MGYPITLLPGDGIGPEVTTAMRRCVEATGVAIDWEIHQVGAHAIKEFGEPMPPHIFESIRRNKVAIKGPIETPVGKGFRSVNVLLRQHLDLYASIRPAKCYPGAPFKAPNVDLVIFRENTEDLYAGIEYEQGQAETLELIARINQGREMPIRDDAGLTIKPISISATRRLARAACEYAVANKRRKVTIIHKANIMKYTDGLFLREALNVAEEYKDRLIVKDCIVDNLSMQLVQRPEHFDVLICPNLYGDIISDLCAGLVGGLGMVPGANIGDHAALFEPVHGSAPKLAGQNLCNPTATILSAVMMLRYMGEMVAAQRLEEAVADVLKEGRDVTADLKASSYSTEIVTTTQMTEAICRRLPPPS